MLGGNAVGLVAEQQRVAVLVGHLVEVVLGVRGEREDAGIRDGVEAGIDVRVDDHVGEVVVVQAGAFEVLVVEIEAERFDKVQLRAGVRRQTDRGARVAADGRVVVDDVEHDQESRIVAVTAIKLDGKLYREEIFADLKARVARLKAEHGVTPGLATVLVGEDPASQNYVRMKHKDCEELGIASIMKELPGDCTQEELEKLIDELNHDPAVTGYIVQLPLPKHLDENRILELIDPAKDADGLHPVNLGKLVLNEPAPLPCTPNGSIKLLERFGVDLNGAIVCVIGRGVTVGRPISLMLTARDVNATTVLCHTGTKELAAETRRADVIIAAAGKPHMITADMIKEGAALLDVGVSRVDGKTVGDLHPDVWEKAGWVSPNPGGVGPMTRTFLVRNIVENAERQAGIGQDAS